MARTFWFKPAKRDQAADVSATPNAQPIAFQQVVPELFRSFIKFLRVTFLLALCWHFWFVKFVTPYPSEAWSWRRGSESSVFRRSSGAKMPYFTGYSSTIRQYPLTIRNYPFGVRFGVRKRTPRLNDGLCNLLRIHFECISFWLIQQKKLTCVRQS